jgi:hypothetical protein
MLVFADRNTTYSLLVGFTAASENSALFQRRKRYIFCMLSVSVLWMHSLIIWHTHSTSVVHGFHGGYSFSKQQPVLIFRSRIYCVFLRVNHEYGHVVFFYE